jgi:glycosyltransferase EpsH
MKLSIIIPCYNVEKFVQKCTESIVMQQGFDFELILVNDGSTDKTLEVLENLAQTDERIKVINQENKGLSGARNSGIEQAQGKYIMFVDADDWLESNAFDIVSKNFNNVDLLCFSYNRVFDHKITPRDLKIEGIFDANFIQRRMVGLIGKELSDPSQADSLVTTWGKIYKTEIIKNHKIQFTDTKLIGTEDALFNIQYLEYAEKVKILNLPLYNYVKITEGSLTKLYKQYLFQQWKILYQKISEIITNKEDEFKVALGNRIALSLIGLGINETYSNLPFSAKIKKIAIVLHDDLYIKAYQNLEMKYFPMHWKLFFYLAKSKNALGILSLSYIMNFLIKK